MENAYYSSLGYLEIVFVQIAKVMVSWNLGYQKVGVI